MIKETQQHPVEYVAARAVLLDALQALQPHLDAMVLAGAQAVYLRSGPTSLPIAEFTTDGDLAIDPASLASAPPLETLMADAGFELVSLQGAQEPGIWGKSADGTQEVSVDLIVPESVAPVGGTRGARLPGHWKRAARKTRGLEAALIDNDLMDVAALDPNDSRAFRLRVAGAAALIVAKTHKISDRIESGKLGRVEDKDAADVLRLMQTPAASAAIANTLHRLRNDPRAAPTTESAIANFHSLFGKRSGAGIQMATRALREAMPAARVRTICLAFAEELATRLRELGP